MNTSLQSDTLSPPQLTALAELLAGRTVTDAATAAGVDRVTLHRWLREDHSFRAAWNRARRELQNAMQTRLLTLAEKAADCVGKAIEHGDGKTALALLRGLGLLPGESPKIGSDDAAELAEDAQIWESEKQSRLERRRILAGFA